jgi:hypothetical protein
MRNLALTLVLLPLPALAQDGLSTGVAFIQAPEQYSGAVFSATATEAFELAMDECTGTGAMAQDCQIMAWCQPAGWSVDVFLQHTEGPHWHEFHCGMPDARTAMAVADAICDRDIRSYLIECAPVQMWDPDGMPQMQDESDESVPPTKE